MEQAKEYEPSHPNMLAIHLKKHCQGEFAGNSSEPCSPSLLTTMQNGGSVVWLDGAFLKCSTWAGQGSQTQGFSQNSPLCLPGSQLLRVTKCPGFQCIGIPMYFHSLFYLILLQLCVSAKLGYSLHYCGQTSCSLVPHNKTQLFQQRKLHQQ